MTTLAIQFRFSPNPEIDRLLDACGTMVMEAVSWALDNNKTATHTIVKELYPSFRERFPGLHSAWVQKSARTAAAIVHAFRRRKRRGREEKDRPEMRKAWVYVDKSVFRWEWDGIHLTIRISVRPHDENPIVLRFRPHGKYRRLVEAWARGECGFGEPTLSRTMLIIPLKFPDVPAYEPRSVMGIDSNERSLDGFEIGGASWTLDTSWGAAKCADHDRRIRRGTKGKQNPKAKKKIIRKHSHRRKNRVRELWHGVACVLIWMALNANNALVLEKLQGLKARIAASMPKRLRQRLLNHWSIRTFHAILKHKARVYGVPLIEIDPRGTSSTCPVCGGSLRGRVELTCPSCGLSGNRHILAAWNIARRGQAKLPIGGKGRAEEGIALFHRLQSPRWGQGVVGAPGRPLPAQAGSGQLPS
ncbi:hypothetical protein HRbin22_00289 [Candidatus Thermoflexus japonica]|uniref:Cas12f1-like TNB domain-containing protein n=1 Tax=Candidatus Thermoflexus japonica TaxID=2035417 RepID=A0A2H5Y3N6_9CHLR|nr:hypothetical protein HRbin22_00289 [Candidatus Thermoflexus japonica]